jgi:eukaryotic-like serine/threonine-protein kinase
VTGERASARMTPTAPPPCLMRDARTASLARFGLFTLNLRAGEVHYNGRRVRLQDQPFRILEMLVEHPGEVVTRDEIRKKLWPNDTVVEFDHSINAAIKKLRIALGDSAEAPSYVETVARRGYRLLVHVKWMEPEPDGQPVVGTQAASASEPFNSGNLTGRRVSHYRVLEVLGGGGMGVVYKAEDIKLGRRVALKFLPEELASDPSAMERFEREARSASALNHPNICTIHEVDDHQGRPFIVMELLEGHTLRELIGANENSVASGDGHKAGLSLETILDVSIQVLEGLDAAHKNGILHRDIKPANIFVTSQGRAKILDFGLAKRQASGADDAELPFVRPDQKGQRWSQDLTLTRTGLAIGTAGYMSPEQIKGEKLDERTDLFSFGLVLYEMAVGRRAFTGESAQILRDAILNANPIAVRELNPHIPPRLEEILSKAMEKDRTRRYQSALEIRTDLMAIASSPRVIAGKAGIRPGWLRRWTALAVLIFALVLACVALWWRKRQPAPLPELTQRQLTANSSENAVIGGAISPDGKRLAYADLKGIHIKVLETGETTTVPQPDSLRGVQVSWHIPSTWTSGASSFIANAKPHGQRPSIWSIPALGGAPRKLRDDAIAWTVSRAGSWVAFGQNLGRLYYREAWVMRPDGEEARKLYEVDENSAIGGAEWSPDGQRLAYVKWHQPIGEKFEWRIESRDLKGGPAVTIAADRDLEDITDWSWVPDGRILYTVPDYADSRENTCNFWQTRVDPRTGELLEKLKRMTNWSGFCVDTLSAAADGKRLMFRRSSVQSSVYLADVQANGGRITMPRRLTLYDGRDYPAAWTADSKMVVFVSNRNGRWELFRQSLSNETAEPIVSVSDSEAERTEAGEFNPTIPRISPDGTWILYVARSRSRSSTASWDLMRVPLAGGQPQLVLTNQAHIHSFRCGRSQAKGCVLAERNADGKQLIFTAFDPLEGRGSELTRFSTENTPDAEYAWDLSPDGTRIALLRRSEAVVRILSLTGQNRSQKAVSAASGDFESVDWTADGTGLLVSSLTEEGAALSRLNLDGGTHVLLEAKGTVEPSITAFVGGPLTPWAIPSPDGRHLAICVWSLNSNLWMMENF